MIRTLNKGFMIVLLVLCNAGYAEDDIAVVMEGKLDDLLVVIASGRPSSDVRAVLLDAGPARHG